MSSQLLWHEHIISAANNYALITYKSYQNIATQYFVCCKYQQPKAAQHQQHMQYAAIIKEAHINCAAINWPKNYQQLCCYTYCCKKAAGLWPAYALAANKQPFGLLLVNKYQPPKVAIISRDPKRSQLIFAKQILAKAFISLCHISINCAANNMLVVASLPLMVVVGISFIVHCVLG